MSKPPRPVFLQRETYRSRRLIDAARLLPLLGAALFAVPLLWPDEAEGGGVSTARALVYLFGVWALLILAALVLSRRLGGSGAGDAPGNE